VYYGPSTSVAVIGPPEGLYTSTTATALEYGTVAGAVVPTSTAYAVVTGIRAMGVAPENERSVAALAVGAAVVLALGMI
jgi:hypothetical protein